MGMGPGHGGGLEVTGPDDPGAMAHRVKSLQGEAGLPLLWLWEEEVWCTVLRGDYGIRRWAYSASSMEGLCVVWKRTHRASPRRPAEGMVSCR